MGLLTHRGPPSWHPATAEIKTACREAADYCSEQGVDIGTLAMAFTLGNENIPTTLVSTASLERIKKNIESCTYKVIPCLNDCMNAVPDCLHFRLRMFLLHIATCTY
jgi:aryl-alcohol dehydrogenase-like predicted oxidoreductase